MNYRSFVAKQKVVEEFVNLPESQPKWGVGKSTLAVHLAVWLYDRGRKTAFVDREAISPCNM
jgi:hypothetical protein